MAASRLTRDVKLAAERLRAGGVVAFPTETVYGLGADAMNVAAVQRVFAIKGRPADHPLIVHVHDAGEIDRWAREIPAEARTLAARCWPGPLTLILKRQPRVPDVVTGGQDSVGLRVPAHPLARELLAAFGGGLAAPSANRYGRVSATRAAHIESELGEAVDLILDGGDCPVGIESTIVSFVNGRAEILRLGSLAPSTIEQILGHAVPVIAGEHASVRVSGRHAAHYAPATPAELVPAEALWPAVRHELDAGRRVAVLHTSVAPEAARAATLIRLPADAAGYGQALYTSLRLADDARVDRLLIEAPPATDAWLAIRDRLARATVGSGG